MYLWCDEVRGISYTLHIHFWSMYLWCDEVRGISYTLHIHFWVVGMQPVSNVVTVEANPKAASRCATQNKMCRLIQVKVVAQVVHHIPKDHLAMERIAIRLH